MTKSGYGELNIRQNYFVCGVVVALILVIFQMPAHTAEVSKTFKERTLAAMKSSDFKKRKAAYGAFQKLGKDTFDAYEDVLEDAQTYHRSVINKTMGVRGNVYVEHALGLEGLQTERARVMGLIHTDWKKDAGKIKMLASEVGKIERKYGQLVKLSKSRTDSIDKRMGTAMSALLETQRELLRIERVSDGEDAEDAPNLKDLQTMLVEDSIEVEGWVKQKELMQVTRESELKYAEAKKHNASSKWANSGQMKFSDHLNHFRVIMGQHPLLLEEQLSDAAEGHSEDMREGDFFSHTSPIEGKASPADRAKVAEFSGGFTGENIYLGSASFTAAYQGWFGSDGHRFIMFTKGASNVIGVGIDGNYWTMMTGRK